MPVLDDLKTLCEPDDLAISLGVLTPLRLVPDTGAFWQLLYAPAIAALC